MTRRRARPGRKPGTVLVQTVISAELASWCRRQADEQGVAIAAWLRALLMREKASGGAGITDRLDLLERCVTAGRFYERIGALERAVEDLRHEKKP